MSTKPARDGIEAQHGLNDVFPGDPVADDKPKSGTFHPPYTNQAYYSPAASPNKGTYSTMNVYNSFGVIVARAGDDNTAALIAAALNAYEPPE
jgi:hypothetical protein